MMLQTTEQTICRSMAEFEAAPSAQHIPGTKSFRVQLFPRSSYEASIVSFVVCLRYTVPYWNEGEVSE